MFEKILPQFQAPQKIMSMASAPANIALIKYWGKRDDALNLPMTDSLSLSLDPSLGTKTTIKILEGQVDQDSVRLNGVLLKSNTAFYQRLFKFLENFKFKNTKSKLKYSFEINTQNSIPTAAGLASSASGYAALVKALDDLFGFHWDEKTQSILARLGSGSAARSLNSGFVHWHAGVLSDGMDSYAEKIGEAWDGLSLGIVMVDEKEKKISSREAMNITKETSKRYKTWPDRVNFDLPRLITAIQDKDFIKLGQIAENNALEMHATLEDSNPRISFSTLETLKIRESIWKSRAEGLNIFFTQDAGPNIKLIYLKQEEEILKELFPKFLNHSLCFHSPR